MAFDGITVAALVRELNHTLTGGRISKIAQPEADELLITVKNQKNTCRLFFVRRRLSSPGLSYRNQ